MVFHIDPSFWFGFSAAALRERGAKIPENIPDCAEYQEPGIFVWTDIKWIWTLANGKTER